jgi:hydrogenase 3 maturation protease
MEGGKRVAVCGVGDAQAGDDAAGPLAIRELKSSLKDDKCMFLDCSVAPQRFIKKVLGFHPDRAVVVAAVEMGKTSGSVEVLEYPRARDLLLTNRMSKLDFFLGYLRNALDEVFLVAVQPREKVPGRGMSPECAAALIVVKDAVMWLVRN